MRPAWLARALSALSPSAADEAQLRAYVLERSGQPETLDHARLEELALCYACVARDATAVARFDATYLARVPSFVRRIDSNPSFADEVQQILRERLFAGAEPKLRSYAAKGSLEGWVRVSATRVALELKRKDRQPHDPGEMVYQLLDVPELDHIKRRYAGELGRAFGRALSNLGDRERTVLSLHLVDGLNIDRIGQLLDVHRATAARWIKDAREQLYDDTRAQLQEELRVSADEFASLARLVQSQLEVSVIRILNEGRAAS